MRRSLLLLAPVLFACRAPAPEQPEPRRAQAEAEAEPAQAPVITGRILDHEGRPLTAGRLEIRRPAFDQPMIATEIRDGLVEAELPEAGAYRILVAGVDNAQVHLSVLVGAEPVDFELRMGTYAREPLAETAELDLRWVDGSGDVLEERQVEAKVVEAEPGRYALELQAPEQAAAVQLQLVDKASGRSFNVPGGERWVYDRRGDYWAEFASISEDGPLILELGELPEPGLERELSLEGARIFPLAIDLFTPYRGRMQAAMSSEGSAEDKGEEVGKLGAELREQIEGLEDRALADAAAMVWAHLFGQFGRLGWFDGEDLRWVFERVPVDDPRWAFLAESIAKVFSSEDPALAELRHEMFAAQEDPGLRAQLLLMELEEAAEAGEQERVAELFARLSEPRYAGSVAFELARARYDPERPLAVGQTMPEWSFVSLDGEASVGSEQLRGRPYLLDIWSTWCGPCVREMEHLHAAYDALSEGGEAPVAFVTLSMDTRPELVQDFRRERWPMPWLNAHVPEAEQDELRREWRTPGLPTTVLVDGEGRIVAADEELHGERLLPTLRAFLAEDAG